MFCELESAKLIRFPGDLDLFLLVNKYNNHSEFSIILFLHQTSVEFYQEVNSMYNYVFTDLHV